MGSVHLLGLSAANTLLALLLKQRGHDVHLWIDRGEDLAQLGGATSVGLAPAERRVVEETLNSADGLSWEFGRHEVVSSLGMVRAADAILPGVLSLARGAQVVVAGFTGWREWSAAMVVSGLEASGFSARAEMVQMMGTPVDASLHQMAARLSDAVFREQLVSQLRKVATGAVQVLLPPISSRLRRQAGGVARDALPNELGLAPTQIGEAVSLIPSLVGERYLETTLRALSKIVRFRGEGESPALSYRGESLYIGDVAAPVVIGSSRALLWTSNLLAPPPARGSFRSAPGALVAKNVWFVGRALQAKSVGDEWSDALAVLDSLSAEIGR